MKIILEEVDKLSPTVQLVNQTYNNFPRNNIQKEIEKINYLKDGLSSFPYDIYKKDSEAIHDEIKRMQDTLNIPNQDLKSISKSLEQMRFPTPIELLTGVTISRSIFDEINDELYHTDWGDIQIESTSSQLERDTPIIDFVTKEPEKFASKLCNHVEELDDDNLNSVFTKEFLNEITQSWWILPRISFEEYEELSQLEIDNSELNKYILGDYLRNPMLIFDLIDNWEFHDIKRARIIIQAVDNYYNGNYEICVLALLLQIEGLMRDEFESKAKAPKLRQKLERKLNNALNDNLMNYSPWEIFLIKSCKSYIWMILKPLCDKVNFIEDENEINRNISAHNGKIEADQKVTIRLFLIIDTLMYLFEII